MKLLHSFRPTILFLQGLKFSMLHVKNGLFGFKHRYPRDPSQHLHTNVGDRLHATKVVSSCEIHTIMLYLWITSTVK